MKFKKLFSILLSILFLLHLTGCAIKEKNKIMSTTTYKLIQNENINDISLKIYYMPQSVLTLVPLDVETFVTICERGSLGSCKIIINGIQLKPYLYQFKRMDEVNLNISSDDYYIDCRIYYILESKKNGVLLEVVPQIGSGMLVNGVFVESNELFYDIITPFLPKANANEFQLELAQRNTRGATGDVRLLNNPWCNWGRACFCTLVQLR